MFYLWGKKPYWLKLANGASMGKGESRSILEIRLESIETAVRQMQLVLGRNGSRVLQENDRNRRKRIHGETGKRQASKRKSIRPLSKTN